MLIKPNQAGTVTEAAGRGRRARGRPVSPRSYPPAQARPKTIIAHLAVGWNAGQLKVGSFSRSERMAKWNECLRIEERMGKDAIFAGGRALRFLRAGTADQVENTSPTPPLPPVSP